MTPSGLSIPTDNIYKFYCLFGLALIISGLFAFVSTYTSTLDRNVKYSEVIIPLEAKEHRTKTDDDMLALNRRLIEVSQSNQKAASYAIGIVSGVGLLLSLYGVKKWHNEIQPRDNRLVELQMEKLQFEVARLRSEAGSQPPHALAKQEAEAKIL